MTTPTTHTTPLDECPDGLVLVAAHGEIPGGLAWKHESGAVSDIAATDWLIPATSAASFEGVPMTAVPTEVLDEIKRADDAWQTRTAAARAAAYMKEGRA